MSALKQIKQKLSEQQFEETRELDLSTIRIGRITEDIRKYLQLCPNVQILMVCDCELESLENLPSWRLTVIDLSNNKLSDNCLFNLAAIATLTQIICVGNQIESVEALRQLSVLQKLVEVDFSENPVSEESNYRLTLFKNIKSLQIVDQKDREGNPVEQQQEFINDEQDEEDESEDQFDDQVEESDEQYSDSSNEQLKHQAKK